MFKNAVTFFLHRKEAEERRGGKGEERSKVSASWSSRWVSTGLGAEGAERLLSQWTEASSYNGIILHLWGT